MALSLLARRILWKRSIVLIPHRSTGYIVLIPELPQDIPDNPLLKIDTLPQFSKLTREKYVTAMEKYALDYETEVRRIASQIEVAESPPSLFPEVLDPLSKSEVPMDSTWGLLKTVYFTNKSMMPGTYYMGIHDRARRVRAMKFNSVPIYRACQGAKDDNITEEQKRVVDKFLLEGRLNGLDLEGDNRIKLNETLFKLSNERKNFRSKVEISTKRFQHTIHDPNIVRDFPDDLLMKMATDSTQPSRGPWTVTLQPQVMHPFMEHCGEQELRWNVWQANVRRSSNNDDDSLRNSAQIELIRSLRRDQAQLLGFSSFGEMSMQTKMAGTVEKVQEVLQNLLTEGYPAQVEELAELQEFAASRSFKGPLQIWDIPYWRRKQQKSMFDYDEEILQEYFPFPKVLSGLFSLTEHLFGIQIQEQPGVDTWHPDVRYFHILEAGCSEPVAGFYIDPYARPEEKLVSQESDGWVVSLRDRSVLVDTQPLSALIFNFQQPCFGKPCLLKFKEVIFLFKKFGHALQHLLTKAGYSEVAGLSNIEWDAVEVCSNFMTHWLYHPPTVQSLSGHYESGEPLAKETVDKLSLLRCHMAGYDLCQELYLASLDLELHTKKEFWLDTMRRLWPQHFVLPQDKYDSHPCSFTAIFSEHWAAAYYSHLWARLIAADCFSAFKESGLNNHTEQQAIGKRFRNTFLALGGGCHPSEVFRRFRGRDPSPQALLKTLGLNQQLLL